ncbi:MAG TPA: hypothetical protein VM451_09315, partial [Candidatus Limnocylindria bacterium]|nr:hypothetical protein [Candidatus Limnocylindria bacterium]
MSEDRMGSAPKPDDAFERRIARYLDWEAHQAGGAGVGAEVASSIAARRTASGRSGRNPALVFAVVAMALIVAATAIAIAGRPPQQLVVVPSIEASAPPTAVPVSDPPATEPPVTAAPDPNCLQLGAGDVYT